MELQLDKNLEYGLVLEGGGARGSYQIGAWKAFAESEISFRGIAGASVGSLNGAMICMGDVQHACDVWENITYSRVMEVDDETMKAIFEKDWKGMHWHRLIEMGENLLKSGGFDIDPLRKLIQDAVNPKEVRDSQTALFMRTISLTDRKPLIVDVEELGDEELLDMLLASAYFPAFKREKLLGKSYLDGGMYDNVPIDVLIDRGYKNVVEFRIDGVGIDRKTKVPEDVKVWKVEPKEDLGGILEFDAENSKRNLTLGYYDAMRLLYGLKGENYYLDAEYDETWCCKQLGDLLLAQARRRGDFENADPDEMFRTIDEKWMPQLVKKFSCSGEGVYEQCYIRLMEHTAACLSIPKFQIYKKGELMDKIREAVEAGIPEGVEDSSLELFR